MRLYPLFADIAGRTVAVVGGGDVAARKTAALLAAGARVRIGAPDLHPQLAQWAAQDRICHVPGSFHEDWLDDVWLVVAATDDAAVNRQVAAAARSRRLWINVLDDAERSSLNVPAVVDRAPLIVAISSGGAAPMLARWLRERLEASLDHALGALAAQPGRSRRRTRAAARQTLAVYMGVAQPATLREKLLAFGRGAETPVALVENGTRPGQRVIAGTLADLAGLIQAHKVQSPALLIIGEVAALAGRLAWFGSAPVVPLAHAA